MARKKWGRIGAPHSAKRRAFMRKIAKKSHRRRNPWVKRHWRRRAR